MPGERLGSTLATLSGVPEVRFAKCVYLKVAKLDGLTIHEPSPVKILSRDSLPVPVVAEAFEAKRSLLSSRFESR